MEKHNKSMTWEELKVYKIQESDRINGPNNAYSILRLHNKCEKDIRVTFFRDHHAWCPYCQKVWLWLEFKEIPYRIKKVTMRCYGNKEKWYLKKVPSGMLPAIELDNVLITESDDIIQALEKVYGPLGSELDDPKILHLRRLERNLFRAWCIWLCNPALIESQETRRKKQFLEIASQLDQLMQSQPKIWFDPSVNHKDKINYPGVGDLIFVPYLERMNASLAYYKGICIRERFSYLNQWFKSLEEFETYKGTQGDFHTHAHDLPPQMGGCWVNSNPYQKKNAYDIDVGKGLGEQEIYLTTKQIHSEKTSEKLALSRVLKHKEKILNINPIGPELFDQPLRAALTRLISGGRCIPNEGSAKGLRYLRDRISVPRDMPLIAARKFRQALEATADLDSPENGPALPIRNRFDQDPVPFLSD